MSLSVCRVVKSILHRHLVRNLLVMFGCSLFAGILYVEFRHWYNFGHLVTSANWNTAVASEPFRIEDDVQRNEGGPFRVQH